jgi:hypothetical protein
MTHVSEQRDQSEVHSMRTPSVFADAHAQIAIIATAVIGLLLIVRWDMLLNDPDTYWHIEIGRWIIANKAFPQTDLWSHTFAGQPWIAKEWLSQVALAIAHSVGGWRGVVILTLGAYLGSLGYLAFWLMQRIQWRYAVCVLAVVFMLSAGSLLARPHVLALPAVLAWTLGLLSQLERSSRPPWWLIAVMIVWANLHAGFTIGFVIAGLIGLEAIRNSGKDWFKTGLQWALFGALAIVATCIGPYGIDPYLITIKLFGANEAVSRIDEWKPLAMDGVGIAFVSIMALLILGLSAQFKRNWIRIALVGILGAMMIKYTRFGFLFAFTAIPIAIMPLTLAFQRLAKSSGSEPAVRNWLVAIVAFGFGSACLLMPAPTPSPLTTPKKALQAAKAAGMTGPVYNSYVFGGFLVFNKIPTYIDGRTDQLFIDGFMSKMDADSLAADPSALIAQLDKTKVDWALLNANDPEVTLLTKAGWTLVHKDSVAVAMQRPKSPNE